MDVKPELLLVTIFATIPYYLISIRIEQFSLQLSLYNSSKKNYFSILFY